MRIRIPGFLISALAAGVASGGPPEPPRAPARIAPLAPEAWSPETRERLEATVGRVAGLEGRAPARVLPILTVIARHPTLLGPFLDFTGTLATRGVLSRRDSELLALRAAWRCRSAFEWGHHVLYARAAGISDAEIARVAVAETSTGWSERERALLSAADELHARQRISAATWATLTRHFDPAQRIELPLLVEPHPVAAFDTEWMGA